MVRNGPQHELFKDYESNVVFDLDGTLSDDSWRAHLVETTAVNSEGEPIKRNWEKYHSESKHDMSIESMVVTYRAYLHQGFGIIILTGRPNKFREQTIEWLHEHNIYYHVLLMRPDNDYTPSYRLKARMLRDFGLTPQRVMIVFDNDERVVNELYDMGYTALLVKKRKANGQGTGLA